MNTITLCSCCEREINENEGINYTLDDQPYCDSCEGQSWQYSNSVVAYSDGEIQRFDWCSEFGFRDQDWIPSGPDAVTGFKYIRTDAWRGYWDPIIAEGYTTLASGWSTGQWDDVSYKHKFNDLVDSIHDGEIECPFEITFAFGMTSNVFSTASDVIIKESDMERFQEWLCEEAGITVEELKRSLS